MNTERHRHWDSERQEWLYPGDEEVLRVAQKLAEAAGRWSAYVKADDLRDAYVDGVIDFVELARVALEAADE